MDNFKISFQDVNGNYYSAVLNHDASYTVTTSPAVVYVSCLPMNWDSMAITWERDNTFLGVFRSLSSGNFQFTLDSRAILKSIFDSAGPQGYAQITIWRFDDSGATVWQYVEWYVSQIDFSKYKDSRQQEILQVSSKDADLIRMIEAYAGTPFYFPFWVQNESGAWEPAPGVKFLVHDGIKARWQQSWASQASTQTPATITLGGFDGGQHGSATIGGVLQPTQGVHSVIPLNPYSVTMNNGATTFIGNDILNAEILYKSQNAGSIIAPYSGGNYNYNESSFSGTGYSQPFTLNNYVLNNILVDSSGAATNINFEISVSLTVIYKHGVDLSIFDPLLNWCLCIALFEIDATDTPLNAEIGGGNFYAYTPVNTPTLSDGSTIQESTILQITGPSYTGSTVSGGTGTYTDPTTGVTTSFSSQAIPASTAHPGSAGTYTGTIPFTVKNGKVYVLSLLVDNNIGTAGTQNWTGPGQLSFTDLTLTIKSNFDNGVSGVPIPAPIFPATVFPAMTLAQVFQNLIPALDTTDTTPYGFPIPVSTPNTAVSNYLSDTTVMDGDCCPAQILLTSDYALHCLQGQSYLTISLTDFTDFCMKVLGMAFGIETGGTGDATVFRGERIDYFFDSSAELLDLGFNVSDFTEESLSTWMGANMQFGYTSNYNNNDFGIEYVNTALFYNTGLTNFPGVINKQHTAITTEVYTIEKKRVQIVTQPVGSVYDQSGQSGGDNPANAFYVLPGPTVTLPDETGHYDITVRDPANNVYTTQCYQLTQRNGVNLPAAQSTNPTIPTYINGAYYPDTFYNLELSPARIFQRGTGAFLHSLLSYMESSNLIFRNAYVMQANNTPAPLATPFQSYIGPGGLVTEFISQPIGSLPAKIFEPKIYTVFASLPVNAYELLNGTRAYGYITWKWQGRGFQVETFKGFVLKVTQQITGGPSKLTLLKCPD